MRRLAWLAVLISPAAVAGPPYTADDPQPTPLRHFEIYLFATGENHRGGDAGALGIDFNYGATPDLQLTAVAPLVYERSSDAPTRSGLGNVELAAKYRFLHQRDLGWDVAVFPRLFLPSASHEIGEQHSAVLLPIWVERDWPNWSTFGGGGWTFNRGDGSRDFYLLAWAIAHQFTPRLQLGAEIQHQSPDARDGKSSTGVGIGARYDLNSTWHLLAYGAPGVEHADETARYAWYASILATF